VIEAFLCGTAAPAVVLVAFGLSASVPSSLCPSVPVTDILWGLAAFALGWLAIEFAEGYEHLAVNIRCACGRREMRDVVCDPQERDVLAGELSKLCPWCAAANRQSAVEVPDAAS